MRVYHRTDHAEAILREGFRDATDSYLTTSLYSGVWFSDVPLDVNEGADGDALLAVEMDEDTFAAHEWVEDAKGYREALVPAEAANRYPVELVFRDEVEEAEWYDAHGHEEKP
jgi:hypothetical protein